MKKTIPPKAISDWFTLGATFSKVNLTEEAAESQVDEPSSKEASPLEAPDEIGVESKQLPGEQPAGDNAPPRLASFQYPNLPISKNREELISLIENNSVVIVRGATGSGKTTQLPQYILDLYDQKKASCNIVVTQPRRIGASSIARWVAKERKCTLGSLVGYQVGLEKIASEQTRLIYMTTGVLLQKLVSSKCLTEYTHIFVDEVHERTEEMDFLLLILRKFLHSNSRYVKIILMSATINCKEFANYFSTPVRGRMSPAYVFEVEGAPYAIEDFYLDDLRDLFFRRGERQHGDDFGISEEMYNLAINLIQSFDEMERKDASEDDATPANRGSVLVFLPGINEIRHLQEALGKLVHKRLQIYPLHSTVTLEEQNGVFLLPIPGYRKVILSTNIAESSVTVPDVKYVIDFCLTRHLVCDEETNYQSLRLSWASKTNCNQRRGRAGRVSKGYCYRLVTKSFWKNDIPDHSVPELLLAPLATIMLKVKLLDMGDPRSILSTALSPPNLSDIVKTVLQLKEMGALSAKSDSAAQNEDGELTFLGRVLAQLPVDLYLGKMIVLGHVFGCLDESLIIAAAHSLKTFFAIPSMQRLAGYRRKLAFASNTPSDAIAFVNAFKAWYSSKKQGHLRHPKEEWDWGKENFIQIKRIREVAELYEELRKRVEHFNMQVPDTPEQTNYTSIQEQKFILQVVIAGAYYPNYYLQAEMDEELCDKELCGHNTTSTVMLRNLPPYSFLYFKQLQSHFRLCGQVKCILFDHSRAYMEFYRTSKDTQVLPEVSLALLLGLQKSQMELSVYPNDVIESFAKNRPITHMKYARVNVDFQTKSVDPLGLGSSGIQGDKLPPNRIFLVNITEVVDVGHFWGFQTDEASLKKQNLMTGEINTRTLQPITTSLYPNLLCLAPYSEISGQSLYYRAKILYIRGNTVEVFFVDFGNTAVVASSNLRELPSDLHSLPFQAQEFQVTGIRPSAQSIINGNPWSSRARHQFTALVKDRMLVSLYSIVHGVMRVQLLISSASKNTDVADILVADGHALKAEESYDSKQIHEDMMTLYRDMEAGTYVPSSVCKKDRQKDDKELIDDLVSHFCKTRLPPSRAKVTLHGPYSPYKVQFHSMGKSTFGKKVCVDSSSINFTALNENPHLKHQRMLVAGSVSVNSSGTQVLLRDTTLMPDILGLPAVITMIFTPIMELRTDEEKTCYTGALCGLGWNRQTQEGILPEHDIELEFDVKFDVEDITEINALRGSINQMLCGGPRGLRELDKISHLQEDCRKGLIRLFTKSPSREAINPTWHGKKGKWNQADPSVTMEFIDPGAGTRGSTLFQLHPVIVLKK